MNIQDLNVVAWYFFFKYTKTKVIGCQIAFKVC